LEFWKQLKNFNFFRVVEASSTWAWAQAIKAQNPRTKQTINTTETKTQTMISNVVFYTMEIPTQNWDPSKWR